MSGIRISGKAPPVIPCSPPLTAYGGAGTTGESGIYRSCEGDAAGEMTLIAALDFADADQCYNPVLSPDGTKILFEVLSPSNDFEIWVVNATPGSTPTRLLGVVDEHYYHPAWGPDSDTFVYVKGTENHTFGPFDVYTDTVSSPGSPTLVQSLASGTFRYLVRPQFNFDGSRIAYMQYDGTNDEFRCMDADGSNDVLLDTISSYPFNDPPGFSWALTQNLVAYTDGASGVRKVYVIDDTGSGKTQLNANGDAAGVRANLSGLAWAPADEFVVISADLALGNGIQPIRAEVDGSDTTLLPVGTGFGPENRNCYRTCLVLNDRIWWIRRTSDVSAGEIQSCALDGSDPRTDFDNTLGSGDRVADFGGGDGFYFN